MKEQKVTSRRLKLVAKLEDKLIRDFYIIFDNFEFTYQQILIFKILSNSLFFLCLCDHFLLLAINSFN